MAVLKNVQSTRGRGKRWRTALATGAVAGAVAAFAPLAHAEVILIGPTTLTPAGIGTVSTLLSLQSQGNATDETARVSWNGATSVATTLNNPAGAAQPGVNTTQLTGGSNNTTRTFSEIGVTQASDLRVLFNINEPPPQADVTLRSLIFTAYDPAGTAVFTASLASPLTLTQVQSGIGTAGYVFGLNASEAALLQAVFTPALRLGIETSISNAQGGFDTFFAGSALQIPTPTPQVSEPGTLALLGLALGGLALGGRRKRT